MEIILLLTDVIILLLRLKFEIIAKRHFVFKFSVTYISYRPIRWPYGPYSVINKLAGHAALYK